MPFVLVYFPPILASMQRKIKAHLSDYVGIASAFLCLIHCLAGPIIMSAGLAAHHSFGLEGANHAHGDHFHSDHFLLHRGWDFVFLSIGLVAVIFSTQHTSNRKIKFLLWTTFSFLAAAILLEEQAPIFQYLVYLASVLLIFAHYTNIKQLVKQLRQKKLARKESLEPVSS